jgi:hypothetical protein
MGEHIRINTSPFFITFVAYPWPRVDFLMPKSDNVQVIEALVPIILAMPLSNISHEPNKRVLPSLLSYSQSNYNLLPNIFSSSSPNRVAAKG